jgi:Fe-S-cluster containining protein
VYKAHPLQCRSYPFWSAIVDSEDSWQEESESCPGMNHGKLYKAEEIQDWLTRREKDPPFDIDS